MSPRPHTYNSIFMFFKPISENTNRARRRSKLIKSNQILLIKSRKSNGSQRPTEITELQFLGSNRTYPSWVFRFIGRRGKAMAGGHGHGHGVTHKGLTLHQPKRWHTVTGKGLCAVMWFWILYRAKQDGPVVLGWRHPWEGHGHGDHGHSDHGHEHDH